MAPRLGLCPAPPVLPCPESGSWAGPRGSPSSPGIAVPCPAGSPGPWLPGPFFLPAPHLCADPAHGHTPSPRRRLGGSAWPCSWLSRDRGHLGSTDFSLRVVPEWPPPSSYARHFLLSSLILAAPPPDFIWALKTQHMAPVPPKLGLSSQSTPLTARWVSVSGPRC